MNMNEHQYYRKVRSTSLSQKRLSLVGSLSMSLLTINKFHPTNTIVVLQNIEDDVSMGAVLYLNATFQLKTSIWFITATWINKENNNTNCPPPHNGYTGQLPHVTTPSSDIPFGCLHQPGWIILFPVRNHWFQSHRHGVLFLLR